jgi:hypothetical protein
MELGTDLPRLWNDPQASVELKKQILRTVIEEIIVKNVPESTEYELHIHWAGGVHTELRFVRNQPGKHGKMTDGRVIELIGELAKVCDDVTIAAVLNRLGYRTGHGNSWSASRISHFRSDHDLAGSVERQEWTTLQEAARMLKVRDTVVKTMIRKGILPAKQVVVCAPWVIAKKDLESPGVQAAVHAVKNGRHIPSTDPAQQQLTI